MNTFDFKTQSKNVARYIPGCPDNYWVVGLDIGYSAVKGMSPNKYYCYPAYAKKVPSGRMSMKDPQITDIYYKDSETGTVWAIGKAAYDEVVASDIADSDAELFGRHRYFSQLFSVVSRAGIALGLMTNEYGSVGNRKIKVQTGLPNEYVDSDRDDIKEALSGRHIFELKVGTSPWQKFDFTLTPDDIGVIYQPLGAYTSVLTDENGKTVPNAKKFNNDSVVDIFDPGFGTLDDFVIVKGHVGAHETFPEFGMHEVFARTCNDIKKEFGTELSVSDLQNRLSEGTVKSIDRKKMKTVKHDFGPILEKNCKQVCFEAVERLKVIHNFYIDVDYIIGTGGTYDAWEKDFNEVFKEMDGLEIIPGNVNVPYMSNIFANVRGYYYYLCGYLRSRIKNEAKA